MKAGPKRQRRQELTKIIAALIVKNEALHDTRFNYYQGFHDIASVFLLTLDLNLAYYCTEATSRRLLSDNLLLDFEKSLFPQLKFLDTLVKKVDPELHYMISAGGM